MVGAGALGFHHARLLREIGGAEFAGFYDADPARAAHVARALGVPPHATYGALLDAADAVCVVVPTPAGRPFTQAMARDLATRERLVFLCGRYEGIDQRVADWAAAAGLVSEVSIGDYVLAGGSNLFGFQELSDVGRLRRLFDVLDQKRDLLDLFDQCLTASGVQIFIGAESGLFDSAGLAMVVAPFRSREPDDQRLLGAIGVIGPARINYGKVIPVVDYTARVIGQLLG